MKGGLKLKSRQPLKEAFLTFQVILLTETNSVFSSHFMSKSPQTCQGKVLQTTSQSPSCTKFKFLSESTPTRLFSNKQTTPVSVANKMSCENPSADCSANPVKSLPENLSIHTANITEVHNVPFKVLIRPFPSVLDEDKVLSLMATMQDPDKEDLVPPIDIMWVKGRQGGDYYYSFGGCHRYEAYKRLHRDTIPCKLFKSSVENLRPYLGASTPDLL